MSGQSKLPFHRFGRSEEERAANAKFIPLTLEEIFTQYGDEGVGFLCQVKHWDGTRRNWPGFYHQLDAFLAQADVAAAVARIHRQEEQRIKAARKAARKAKRGGISMTNAQRQRNLELGFDS